MSERKVVVGSEEWCSFPDMGIPAIRARVDSGARTSALHAFNIQTFRRAGETWVSFEVHPVQNDRRIVTRHEAKVVDRRDVRNTGGIAERRYVIRERLQLGEDSWEIELTLANRDSMGYRMLLGRSAMVGRMLVDPGARCKLGERSAAEIESIYAPYRQLRDGLRVAVLASDPELYSNRRLIEAGEERGHEMMFLNMRQCYIKLDADRPEVHYRGGQVIEGIDAVIPRLRPKVTFYGCALVRQFESMGVKVLNDAESIRRSRDKLHASQLFIKHKLGLPITGFAYSPDETTHLIEMVGGAPLVLKLLESTQGRGVVLAETQKAAESVINAIKSLNANLLVQEFVRESGGRDLRCFVVDGKVVASIERRAAPGEFRANLHQGGTASVIRITAEERRLAVRAARVLDLDVCGVDILRSDRGPLLIEVNSSPGLEGVETATGKDVAGMVIAAVERKTGWRRDLAADLATP
jgi:ribosomal protein S6--L-glutamate ligase